MIHFFEQINQLLKDAEFAGILITILFIVLLISLIALNITGIVCAISMRKSLKRIAGPKVHKHEKPTEEKLK